MVLVIGSGTFLNSRPMRGDEHAEESGTYAFRLTEKARAPRAKHNQGVDGPAAVPKVSVNIKIDVQWVRLNLCKSGLSSAYRARVKRLEHGAGHPDNTCSFSSRDAGSVRF